MRYLCVRVGRAELATLSEIADVVVEPMWLGKKFVRQLQQFLEIAVPGCKLKRLIKHRDTVDHIVECDPQLHLSLADLVEKPGILHRDHRLHGEIFEK